MYPPQELFTTIKSIENNCKAKKASNPTLRYQVRLGDDNIELWIKVLGDKGYTKVNPDIFGPYTQPNIQNITTTPNLGVSPPKGRVLKRPRESPEAPRAPPKSRRTTVSIDQDLDLSPGWMKDKTFQTPTKTPGKVPKDPTNTPSTKQTPTNPYK